ncbi:hypothetical protein D3C78_1072070 [compost metagenome]
MIKAGFQLAQRKLQQFGPGGRAIYRRLECIEIGGYLTQFARRQLQLLLKLSAVLFGAFNRVQQLKRAGQILLSELIDRGQRLLLVQGFNLALNFATGRQVAIQGRIGRRLAHRTNRDQ